MARVLERHEVAGLLTATWERHETTVTGYVGRGRGGPDRPTRTEVQVRYVLTGVQRHEEAIAARRHRLGWRVQVTNAPVDRLSLPQAVRHYRGGWSLERDFHLLKDLPLGLSPLFVWKEEQIKGLTRLLTLALRLLTLLETQVRRGLEQTQEPSRASMRAAHPHDGAAHRHAHLASVCPRPDHLDARGGWGRATCWHLTPLSPLHEQLLRHLHLPTSLYTALA